MRLLIPVLLLLFSTASYGYSVGSQYETVTDQVTQRALQVRLFYPTDEDRAATRQGENQVFTGFSAVADARPAAGRWPLVILSHGSGGNNTSLAWLAVPLAAQGVIVIAANHPGSTTGDSRPETDLTLQTGDLQFLLSHYLQATDWRERIDSRQIGAIGHSKGGYSVLALAGAQISRERMTAYCNQQPAMPDCQFYRRGGVQREHTDATRLAASYRDPRVKWVLALDPGMSYVFTPASLQQITIPVQVLAAGYYIHATGAMTLGAGQLPLPVSTLSEAGHFDFLPLCQPQAQQILAEDGEAFICETPAGQRQAVHRQAIAAAEAMLRGSRPEGR